MPWPRRTSREKEKGSMVGIAGWTSGIKVEDELQGKRLANMGLSHLKIGDNDE